MCFQIFVQLQEFLCSRHPKSFTGTAIRPRDRYIISIIKAVRLVSINALPPTLTGMQKVDAPPCSTGRPRRSRPSMTRSKSRRRLAHGSRAGSNKEFRRTRLVSSSARPASFAGRGMPSNEPVSQGGRTQRQDRDHAGQAVDRHHASRERAEIPHRRGHGLRRRDHPVSAAHRECRRRSRPPSARWSALWIESGYPRCWRPARSGGFIRWHQRGSGVGDSSGAPSLRCVDGRDRRILARGCRSRIPRRFHQSSPRASRTMGRQGHIAGHPVRTSRQRKTLARRDNIARALGYGRPIVEEAMAMRSEPTRSAAKAGRSGVGATSPSARVSAKNRIPRRVAIAAAARLAIDDEP